MFRLLIAGALSLALSGCAAVNADDTASWSGQSVNLLDRHPVFLAMPMEVRRLDDGTEIRNYVNGKTASSCFARGSLNSMGQTVVMARTSSFCSTGFAACNNIFYIRNGVVEQYTPIGSGGASCITNKTVRPSGWQGQTLRS